MTNYRLDLHTHSVASGDGGMTAAQYQKVLSTQLLDYIAVTDHNRTDFATQLHEQLGDKIIIGEEIMTSGGEIIGLFLKEPVEPHLTAEETVRQIKQQSGLVYVPHPFETFRKGLHPSVLETIAAHIDIIEVCNGRALLQNRGQQAVVWARLNNVLAAASSDAHGLLGLGKTFTVVSGSPNRQNLLGLMSGAKLMTDRPGLHTLLYPKFNRLRKKIQGVSYE